MTSIGSCAFGACDRLKKVIISDFAAWCNISFRDSNSNPLYYAHHLYLGEEEIVDLKIPDGVSIIKASTFYGGSNFKTVEIPNSVTLIGDNAFSCCSGLKYVEIPNSVTSIGDYTFASCKGLTAVKIPNLVTSIGNGTFSYCSGLTSVEIPNSVTSIGDDAFSNCSGLKSVEIPNSVTEIGFSAFSNCTGLTSVYLGDKVEIVDDKAFYGCNRIQLIECYNPMPPECYIDVFLTSITSTCKLRVPTGSLDAYRVADTWCDFVNIEGMVVESGIDDIVTDAGRTEVARYDVNGRKVDADYRGLVIVRYNDGFVKKMVIK